MYMRKSNGATLALIVVSVVVIIMVGVGLFFIMQLFGGFGELGHLTDAGNLTVAKRALKEPSIPVRTLPSFKDFSALVDTNGEIDLLTYNRAYGQSVLVAMNAYADRPQSGVNGGMPPGGMPAPGGTANAATLALLATGDGDGNGLGFKLGEKLGTANDSNPLYDEFNKVARNNSTKMLKSAAGSPVNNADHDVAFMNAGGPTNVWLDTSIVPRIGGVGAALSSDGRTSALFDTTNGIYSSLKKNGNAATPYLVGYRKFPVGGLTLIGASLDPTRQPARVSARDFSQAKTTNDSVFAGLVPPNAFKSVSNGSNQQYNFLGVNLNTSQGTTPNVRSESYAVAAAIGKDFPVSIPYGYILVYNPAGAGGNSVTIQRTVYNDELMSGIYISEAPPGSGQYAYSTDPSKLAAWASYNNGGQVGPRPGTDGIFFSGGDGNPSNITQLSNHDGGTAGDVDSMQPCLWEHVQGPNATTPCARLKNDFENAYPPSPGEPAAPSDDKLTAVEKFKEDVISRFNTEGNVVCQGDTGLRYWDYTGRMGSGSASGAGVYGNNDNVGPGSTRISRPGTIKELLSLFNNPGSARLSPDGGTKVLTQIVQRMREIHPETTAAQAEAFLNDSSLKLALGGSPFKAYIYYKDDTWHFDTAIPPGIAASGDFASDGSIQTYQNKYDIIGTMVNPEHEVDIHERLYTHWGTAPGYSKPEGVDTLIWQPSSGFKNILGRLQFGNSCNAASAERFTVPD